jgi:hypothetical protein
MEWYQSKTCADQGLVVCQETGADIAVVYDKAHTPLIAAAPALLDAAQGFLAELDSGNDFAAWEAAKAKLRQAVQDAKEEPK